MRRLPRWNLIHVALACIASLAAMLIVHTGADPDLWGHLRFGMDMLASGRLASHDPYSFTSDIPWVNHEWLAEVIFAALFSRLGAIGITLLKTAIVGAVAAIAWRGVRRAGGTPFAAAALTTALVIVTSYRTVPIRPQLFSVLFFTLLLVIADRIEHGRERAALAIPLLFCVWANAHGGWIVGFGALTLWAIWTRRFVLIAAAAAGTLVNPYGIGLWFFIRDTVGLARPDISDWLPIYRLPLTLIPVECAVPALAVAAMWYTRRIPPARQLAVLGLLAFGTVRVGRIDAFLHIAVVAICAPALAAAANAFDERLRRSGALTRPSFACTAAASAIVAVAASSSISGLGRIAVEGPWIPDRDAVQVLRERVAHTKLITWFDWGEYAIWHLSPNGVLVSMDGRRETVYSDRVLHEHFAFYDNEGAEAWRYPDRIGAESIWLPKRLPIVKVLSAHGWHAVFESPVSVVLQREPTAVRATPPIPPAAASVVAFPGP
ncbi:MAG TPA: hypothetical protein VFB07_07540 [Vicinamibacterales bacterium]|nr:hypothetical protein [Vicinamibacterales bacterium]